MKNLNADQANAVHRFFHVLRKLGVVGLIKTNVRQSNLTEHGRPIRYDMSLDSYDPSYKGRLVPEEQLLLFFSYVEELGYDDDTCNEPLGSCRQRD